MRLGWSVWAATTVGVRSYDGRCAQLRRSVRTVGCFTDGHGRAAAAAGSGWTSATRADSLALRLSLWWDMAAETIIVPTLYGGRSEGNSLGKSACLLDYAGAAEGLGAATGYRPSRRCLALPQELGAERVGVIRRRENPGGGPGVLLAVWVFLSRYKGNLLPGPGNAR